MEADQPLQEVMSLLLKTVHVLTLILIAITRAHKDHEEDLVNPEQLEPL